MPGVTTYIALDPTRFVAGSRRVQAEGRKLSSTGTSLKKLFGTMFAGFSVAVVLRGIQSVVTESLRAAAIQEAAERKVQAQIAATGNAIGVSLEEYKALAAGIQRATGIGDEAILGNIAILQSFKQVGRDVFGSVIEIAEDMAAVLRQDSREVLIQVAKAMEDPVRGMTALRRSGTQFTEQQEEMVRALVESGKTLEAQKFILGELSAQYGGAANAMREVREGQLRALSSETGDLTEQVGFLIDELSGSGGLIEDLIVLVRSLKETAAEVRENDAEMQALTLTLKAMLLPLRPVIRGWDELIRTLKTADEAKRKTEELAAAMEETLRAAGLLPKELNVQPFERYNQGVDEAAELQRQLELQGAAAAKQIEEEARALADAADQADKAREAIRELIAAQQDLVGAGDAAMQRLAAQSFGPEAVETIDTGEAAQRAAEEYRSRFESIFGPLIIEEIPEEMGASMASHLEEAAATFGDALEREGRLIGEIIGAALADGAAGLAEMFRNVNLSSGFGAAFGGAGAAAGGILGSLDLGRTGSAIAGGAAAGAQIGVVFGGIGAIVGAVVGALAGALADMMATTDQAFLDFSASAEGLIAELHDASGGLEGPVQDLFEAIDAEVMGILRAIGGTFEGWTSVGILLRKDSQGLRVAIDGVWTQFGDDVQAAADFIITSLLTSGNVTGVSDTVRAALEGFAGGTAEELRTALDFALAIDELGIEEYILPIRDEVRRLFALISVAAQDFGGVGIGSGAAAVATTLGDAYSQLLGIQEPLADQVEARFRALEAETLATIANLRALLAETEAKAAGAEATVASTRITGEAARLLAESSAAGAQAQAGLGMGIAATAEVAAVSTNAWAAASASIREAIAALEALDFGAGALAQAQRAAAAAAGAANRAQREAAAESRRRAEDELALREAYASGGEAAGDLLRQQQENEAWVRQMEEALGAEGRARAESILVMEEALRVLEEIIGLGEGIAGVAAPFREALETRGMSDTERQIHEARRRADEAIAEIARMLEESGGVLAEEALRAFRDIEEALAAEIGDIRAAAAAAALDEMRAAAARQAEELAAAEEALRAERREAAEALQAQTESLVSTLASMGSSVAQGVLFARQFRDAQDQLNRAVAAGIITAAQAAQAAGEVGRQAIVTWAEALESFTDRWFGRSFLNEEQLAALRNARYVIELGLLRTQLDILYQMEQISQEIYDTLSETLDTLPDLPPPPLPPVAPPPRAPQIIRELNDGLEQLQNAAQSFLDSLASMETAQLDPLEQIRARFSDLRDQAHELAPGFEALGISLGSVLGRLQDLEAMEIDRLFAEANEGLLGVAQSILGGSLSGLPPSGQAQAALAEVRSLIQKARGDDFAAIEARRTLATGIPDLLGLAAPVLGAGGMAQLRREMLQAIGSITGTGFGGGLGTSSPQGPRTGTGGFSDVAGQIGSGLFEVGSAVALASDREVVVLQAILDEMRGTRTTVGEVRDEVRQPKTFLTAGYAKPADSPDSILGRR